MDHVLRTTASATQAGDWALVLEAAAIGHRVDERDGHFALVIDAADVAAATEALAGFDEEGAPEQQPPAPDSGWSLLGVMCAIGFLAMLQVTGTARRRLSLVRGRLRLRRADHARCLVAGGHGNHFARGPRARGGNAIASLVFITAVGRWLGAGLGALVILLAAATGGNMLTAIRHRTDHESVGASTATFAALAWSPGCRLPGGCNCAPGPGTPGCRSAAGSGCSR